MSAHAQKTAENKITAHETAQLRENGAAFEGPNGAVVSRLSTLANGSQQATQLKALQEKTEEVVQRVEEPALPNNTGLPDTLKAGIENLSGLAMDDVKVHYNSPKPQELQAHAYAQGTDIHVAPGQEKHLPHEVWHVVQQKQGRVRPTRQLKSSVAINDDSGLEKEADAMGEKAVQLKAGSKARKQSVQGPPILQGRFIFPTAGPESLMMGELIMAAVSLPGAISELFETASKDARLTLEFVANPAPHGHEKAFGATGVYAMNDTTKKWDSIASISLGKLDVYKTNPHVYIRITYKTWTPGKAAHDGQDLYTLAHELAVHAMHAWPKALEILGLPGKKFNRLGKDLDEQHDQFLKGENLIHARLIDRLLKDAHGNEARQGEILKHYAYDLVVQSQDEVYQKIEKLTDEVDAIQAEYNDLRVLKPVNEKRIKALVKRLKERGEDHVAVAKHYIAMAVELDERSAKRGMKKHALAHKLAQKQLKEMVESELESLDDLQEILEEMEALLPKPPVVPVASASPAPQAPLPAAGVKGRISAFERLGGAGPAVHAPAKAPAKVAAGPAPKAVAVPGQEKPKPIPREQRIAAVMDFSAKADAAKLVKPAVAAPAAEVGNAEYIKPTARIREKAPVVLKPPVPVKKAGAAPAPAKAAASVSGGGKSPSAPSGPPPSGAVKKEGPPPAADATPAPGGGLKAKIAVFSGGGAPVSPSGPPPPAVSKASPGGAPPPAAKKSPAPQGVVHQPPAAGPKKAAPPPGAPKTAGPPGAVPVGLPGFGLGQAGLRKTGRNPADPKSASGGAEG